MRALLVAFAALTGAASVMAAEPPPAADSLSLEGLPIRSISIETRDIFEPVPEGPLNGVYQLANTLHIQTRDVAVRDQLLFAVGDRWSFERRDETMRALRGLDFLEPLRIDARRRDDSLDVTVITQDGWTTRPELNLERGGGRLYGTIGLSERNLLGFGKGVGIFYSEDPTGITRSIAFSDPAVFGTRVRFQYGAGTGTSGSQDVMRLARPFFAQDTPWAFNVSWARVASIAHLFESGSEVASVERDVREIEGWLGVGTRRRGTVWRATGSLLVLHRALGPTVLLPGASAGFAREPDSLNLTRLGVELRWWRPRFLQRVGLQRFDRVEDYDIGTSLTLGAGIAPEALGSSDNEGFVRARFDTGIETRMGFGLLRTSASARLQHGPLEFERRLDARWYVQSQAGHALELAAIGVAGTTMPADFQVVVGGLNGLRAYPVQALAGEELIRLNAEQRIVLHRNVAHLFSLGIAGFYDAARAWGTGAEGTGWFNDAGFGVRITPPSAALGPNFRLDVAWPISPTRDGVREAVFTFGSSQAF